MIGSMVDADWMLKKPPVRSLWDVAFRIYERKARVRCRCVLMNHVSCREPDAEIQPRPFWHVWGLVWSHVDSSCPLPTVTGSPGLLTATATSPNPGFHPECVWQVRRDVTWMSELHFYLEKMSTRAVNVDGWCSVVREYSHLFFLFPIIIKNDAPVFAEINTTGHLLCPIMN